jgi:hypothetical protein
MLRKLLACLAVLGVAPAFSDSAIVESGRSFDVELTGKAAAPDVGDPDGSGHAHLDVNPGRQLITWSITVTAIDSATAAHLHKGLPGQTGPVVVTFDPPPRGGAASDTVQVDRALALDILQHPRDYYVDVHNRAFPADALRGPLER